MSGFLFLFSFLWLSKRKRKEKVIRPEKRLCARKDGNGAGEAEGAGVVGMEAGGSAVVGPIRQALHPQTRFRHQGSKSFNFTLISLFPFANL
jgi:hypothetical protein